jgi:hypothetical protein
MTKHGKRVTVHVAYYGQLGLLLTTLQQGGLKEARLVMDVWS